MFYFPVSIFYNVLPYFLDSTESTIYNVRNISKDCFTLPECLILPNNADKYNMRNMFQTLTFLCDIYVNNFLQNRNTCFMKGL